MCNINIPAKNIKPIVTEALVFLYILAYVVSNDIKRATFTSAIQAVNAINIFIYRIIIMKEKRVIPLLKSRCHNVIHITPNTALTRAITISVKNKKKGSLVVSFIGNDTR
ncbi:MAG: hypothetical protein WAJ93_13950 [Candidatus Nitrosopolaris sp.]